MCLKSNIKKILPVCLLLVFLINPTVSGITIVTNNSLSSITTSSCLETTQHATEVKSWTIMVYSCADNDLEKEGIDSLNFMEYVGSNQEINIIVQFDTESKFVGGKRYYITRDENYSKEITSPVLQHIHEPNMGHPKTLSDFVCWAYDQYPAEHYGLIIWDHGNGWRGGTAYDTTNNDHLTMKDLKTAMNTIASHLNKKLDFLLFDACLMAMTEVYYQIHETTNICIGSEALIPGIGCPYHMIFADLQKNPQATPNDICHYIIDNYILYYNGQSRLTMAAFNNSRIYHRVSNKLDKLAQTMLQNITQLKNTIQEAISNTQTYQLSYYKDLYDFAKELHLRTQNRHVQLAAKQLMNEIENATIVLGKNQAADSHGISIYLPTQHSDCDKQYTELDLSHDTQWDEFIVQYTKTKQAKPFLNQFHNSLGQAFIYT